MFVKKNILDTEMGNKCKKFTLQVHTLTINMLFMHERIVLLANECFRCMEIIIFSVHRHLFLLLL